MSRVYTQADYEGVVDDQYRRYPFHAERAALINREFPGRIDDTTFIAGCGWGFLLDELQQLGWSDLWGMDASEYATGDRAPSVLSPTLANRVFNGDITVQRDIQDARNRLGRPRFIVTEDVLTCAESETEVQTMLSNLRGLLHPQGSMAHIATPLMPDATQMVDFLWRTGGQWRTIVGTGERIWLAGSYEEVP